MTTYQVPSFSPYYQSYDYHPDEPSYLFTPHQPRSPHDQHTLHHESFAQFHGDGGYNDSQNFMSLGAAGATGADTKFPTAITFQPSSTASGLEEAIEEHRRVAQYSPVSGGGSSPVSRHSDGGVGGGAGRMSLPAIRPSIITQLSIISPKHIKSSPSTSSHHTPLPSPSPLLSTISPSSSSTHRPNPKSPSTTSSSNPAQPRATCTHPICISPHGIHLRTYSRSADLQRHHRSAHERRYIDCPFKRCSRKGDLGFTRNDHLMEHRRQFHMEKLGKKVGGKKGHDKRLKDWAGR